MDLTKIRTEEEIRQDAADWTPLEKQPRPVKLYLATTAAAVYLFVSMFVPVFRVWDSIPFLAPRPDPPMSIIEEFKNFSTDYFRGAKNQEQNITNLASFVFSPDGRFIILLYRDHAHSLSKVEVREISDQESDKWKTWKSFTYELDVVAVNAYADTIALVIKSESVKKTGLMLIDYNGETRATESFEGKVAIARFSGSLLFLAAGDFQYLVELTDAGVFRAAIPSKSRQSECRKGDNNSFICLSAESLHLKKLTIFAGQVKVDTVLIAPEPLNFWVETEGKLFYHLKSGPLMFAPTSAAAGKVLSSKPVDSMPSGSNPQPLSAPLSSGGRFPSEYYNIQLLEVKTIDGASVIALSADDKLMIFRSPFPGAPLQMVFSETQKTPVRQIKFQPSGNRLLLGVSRLKSDYATGELKIYKFN